MVLILRFAPVFFGQKVVDSSLHNADFEDKSESMSSTHLRWAQFTKERFTQEENNLSDLDKIVDRLKTSRKKTGEVSKMVMPEYGVARAAEGTFISIFALSDGKWSLQQTPLRVRISTHGCL